MAQNSLTAEIILQLQGTYLRALDTTLTGYFAEQLRVLRSSHADILRKL